MSVRLSGSNQVCAQCAHAGGCSGTAVSGHPGSYPSPTPFPLDVYTQTDRVRGGCGLWAVAVWSCRPAGAVGCKQPLTAKRCSHRRCRALASHRVRLPACHALPRQLQR